MTFHNMKIGLRLSLAFIALLALTVVLGVVSIERLAAVNAATEDIATNWLPATRALGAFDVAMNGQRRAEALIAVATSPDVVADQKKRLEAARAKADAALAAYAATADTPQERPLLEAMAAAAKAYQEGQARTLDLAKGEDAAGAFASYNVGNRARFEAVEEAIARCTEFQTQAGDASFAHSQEAFARTRMLVVVLLIAMVVAGAVMGWRMTRGITGPIGRAVALAETVAAGDLTTRMEVTRRDETGQLLRALLRMNDRLADIVGDVRNATDSIATGATQIASGNADLSQRTEEQASNLQQTAASMEQLTVTVKHNADSAQQARELSATAQEAADQGGRVMGQVMATMEQISTSSRKIGDIIGVIDGIAFQTNILALNAAVEAARAGEQGRGFAVVATEVRSLAQRSAQAAREIKSLIAASSERVEQGTALVNDAGSAIAAIVAQVRRVNDLVGEISAASIEQTAGIGQVGDAVMQLDQVTQQNAALVEESAAAAESLRQQAGHMTQSVAVFRLR